MPVVLQGWRWLEAGRDQLWAWELVQVLGGAGPQAAGPAVGLPVRTAIAAVVRAAALLARQTPSPGAAAAGRPPGRPPPSRGGFRLVAHLVHPSEGEAEEGAKVTPLVVMSSFLRL